MGSVVENLPRGDYYLPSSDGKSLREGTYKDRIYRILYPANANEQDCQVANILTNRLVQTDNLEQLPNIITAATKFYKKHKSNDDLSFIKLRTVISARKCNLALNIPMNLLINRDGNSTRLLNVVTKNHLHHIILKSRDVERRTAFVFQKQEIWIRSLNGENFLESYEGLERILNRVEKNSPAFKDLVALREAYQGRDTLDKIYPISKENIQEQLFLIFYVSYLKPLYNEEKNFAPLLEEMRNNKVFFSNLIAQYDANLGNPDELEKIKEIVILRYVFSNKQKFEMLFPEYLKQLLDADKKYYTDLLKLFSLKETIDHLKKKLHCFHFQYTKLSDVSIEDDYSLKDFAYLADGLEKHNKLGWKKLKPTFRKNGNENKIRIVTYQAPYSLEKGWWNFFFSLLKQIFHLCLFCNADGNGHSWLELDEVIKDEALAKYLQVFPIGYDPREKGLDYPDPSFSVPEDRRKKKLEREISSEDLLRAKEYSMIIHNMLRNDVSIEGIDRQKLNLQDEDYNKVQCIYSRIKAGTCLNFAVEVYNSITKESRDFRPIFLRTFWPRHRFFIFDHLAASLAPTFLLRKIFHAIRIAFQVQIPHFFRREEAKP